MNVQQVKKALEPFTLMVNAPTTIGKVAFRNGVGYATDGRIAVKVRIDDPDEEIPEEDGGCFPFAKVDDLVAEAEVLGKWYRPDLAAINVIDKRFANMVHAEMIAHDQYLRERHIESVCPCCRETVWIDTENESVVKVRKEEVPFSPKNVLLPMRMSFAADGGSCDVGFWYVQTVLRSFGDAIFTMDDGRHDGVHLLMFRSRDCSAVGALMPLTTCIGYEPEAYVRCREVENV